MQARPRRIMALSQQRPDRAANLRVGDVVLLYYNADKRFVTDSAGKSGFILADLSGSGSQQLLTVKPAETSQQNLPNLHFGTFKVLSSNKYEAQTRYRALLEKLKEFKRKKAGQNTIQLLQLQVTQAKRDGEVERAENAAKQRRLQGSNVYYGDSIQLLHTLTGKYVCVSTTDTSVTENTKLRVYLQRKDSVGCIFRLHPHIKVQTIGEEVNYDDQIKFESVATEGQYLHCSKKTFSEVNINAYSECFELNLAAKDSPLKIIHHYHPTTRRDLQVDSTLKASGIVRFFHRKHQCYIVGEGSFTGQYGHLPKMEDAQAGQNQPNLADELTATMRRISVVPKSPRLQVKADVHVDPLFEEETCPDSISLYLSEQAEVNFAGDRPPSLETASPTPSARPISPLSLLPPLNPSRLKSLTVGAHADDVVAEDVHFQRKRRKGNLQSSQASTSPNTFWQIEKFANPFSGEPMQWSEQCRIKHLPTRRYLAVTGNTQNYKVTLKSHKLSPSATVFEIFPVVQQVGGEIDYESYVRVKHRDTGTWLHLNKDLRYISDHSEDTSEKTGILSELEETGELFEVVATKDINSDDAFTLEKVEDELVSDFNYVAGVTAVLTNQLQQCEVLGGGKPHSPKDCHMGPALSSLQYLQSLLLKKKENIKYKQKLIRCLGTLVMVVRLLDLHRNENSNDPEVCTACFGVIINFLEGKSKKNKSYVSSMMKHIFTTSVQDTELIGSETVEKALVGIAKDNPNVLYEEVLMRRIIDYVMQKLIIMDKESPKTAQMFEILSALCTCKGVPVQQNQLIILEQLQSVFSKDTAMENKLLYPLRIKPSDELADSEDESSVHVVINLEQSTDHLLTSRGFFQKWKKNKRSGQESQKEKCIQFQAMPSTGKSSAKILKSGFWYPLSKGGRQFQKYLVAQLNLLVQMCRGDNTKVIQTLQGAPATRTIGMEIDFDLIMSTINDKKVKESYPKLRAVLVEMMKAMYVEVGENRPYVEKFPFSFKINEVGRVPFESSVMGADPEKAARTALTGVENPYFPDIKEWIQRFFFDESQYFFAADENDRNEVVIKVLQILTSLVKFGYYDDSEDLKPLLPSIFKLLNGKEDFPTEKVKFAAQWTFKDGVQRQLSNVRKTFRQLSIRQSSRRYHFSEKEEATDADEAPEISDSEVDKILTEFRGGGKRYEYEEEHQNHFKIKHWAMEVLNLLFNFQLYKSLHRFIYDFRWLVQSSAPLQEEMEANDFELVAVKQPRKLKRELNTLITTNPRDPKFYQDSRKQAKKIICSARNRLKFITKRADSLDLSFQQQLPEVLLDLANYKYDDIIQDSLLLLDRYYTSQSDIFQRALQSQLLMTPQSSEFYNTVEGLLLEVDAFLRSGSGADKAGKDPSPVKVLTEHCWLKEEVEGFEPHQINQNIILSFGTFPDILNFVIEYCNGQLRVEPEHKKKLIECFALLRALACQNSTIQNRLLKHLDTFIKAASGEMGPYIGQLLHEIFKGGPSITLSLKDDQLWKMMRLIFAKGKEKDLLTNSELLEALHELLLVREFGLPLKHNQLIVVRFISLIRDDDRYWCKDLLAEGRAFLRWQILTGKDDADPRLVNLLMITDLLATCAYGDNTGVDSVCCTIYSEEELVEIISSKEISLYRKRPFMKLLVWVYMNVHGDKADERSYYYRQNKDLWDHMSKMAAALQHMSETMKIMPHSSYLSVKELVASPSWKYIHNCPDRKNTHMPTKIDITEDESTEISDLLLYLTEGFFPFLQIFYSEFYRSGRPDQRQLEGDSTESVLKMLLSLHPVLNGKRVYFSQEAQLKLYFRVLFLVKPYAACDLSTELDQISYDIENTEEVFQQDLVSEARENYQALYQEERELNETFSQFVCNYKSAYEGRNTRKNQIIDGTVKKQNINMKNHPYSDFLDEDMKKPGPKFLPLGRSFQEHVAIFNSPELCRDKEKNPKDKLLKQLEISLSKRGDNITGHLDIERQAQLDIKCLQILRATIYNQIILVNDEDKERNPKTYKRQCEHHLHPVQNEIQDLGNTVSRVIPLLSHSNEKIVYEVLAFLEALLEFGNTHVQDGLKEIIQTREHQVFPTLRAILKKAAIVYKESQLLVSLLRVRVAFDRRIVMSAKMIQDGENEGSNSPISTAKNQRKSKVKTDSVTGQVVVSTERRSSLADIIFRRRESTKFVLVGIDNRIPFMAVYQQTDTDTEIGDKALRILRFYDLSRISLISKVLGLMCDGQYKDMQNYLREQSEDIFSVNMVGEIASFLYEFSKKQVFSVDTLKLFNQLLQALIEFCIGNYKNREVVFNANIISVINFVLQIDITKIKGTRFGRNREAVVTTTEPIELESSTDQRKASVKTDYVVLRKMALEMKASAVQLLDALLEEISNKSSTLSHQIAEGLDVTALHRSMLDFFILKSDPDLVRVKYEDNASRALFDSYKIIQHLVDSGFAPIESLTPTEKTTLKAWEYCEERSRSIEVVYRDEETKEEVLTRVHFNVNVESNIREQLRDTVKFQVDRSTHGDKLRDFHEWMAAIKKDTLHHEWLKRKHLNGTKLLSTLRYWLLLLVTLALNIIFIIYFVPDDINEQRFCAPFFEFKDGNITNPNLPDAYVVANFVLGSLYAILVVWMLLEYFTITWPHFVLPKFLYSFKNYCRNQRFLSWFSRLIILPDVERTYSSVNIFGVKTLYLLSFLVIAASPFFCIGYLYCISFFYIIINNDILQRALQSVTRNWKSLVWVAILLLIIVYIYAVISFAAFRTDFDNRDQSVFCTSLDECFISVLRFGLIDNFLEIPVGDFNAARNRFFFDITFFIIVTTIGLNIVFGIIVDTFSELRDAKFNAEQDMKSNCFICGIPSHEFEKLGNNGFESHIRKDHNMWAYVYYSMYLDQIDVTNHNAIEKYVYEKIQNGSIDYIPFQKALVLEGLEEDEELKKELERLEISVNETFNTLSHRFDTIESLMQARNEA